MPAGAGKRRVDGNLDEGGAYRSPRMEAIRAGRVRGLRVWAKRVTHWTVWTRLGLTPTPGLRLAGLTILILLKRRGRTAWRAGSRAERRVVTLLIACTAPKVNVTGRAREEEEDALRTCRSTKSRSTPGVMTIRYRPIVNFKTNLVLVIDESSI